MSAVPVPPPALPYTSPKPTLTGRLAAVGTRGLVRFAQWRGRRQAQADLARPTAQVFRGVIQINLIRPH